MITKQLDQGTLRMSLDQVPETVLGVMRDYGSNVVLAGGLIRSVVAGEEIRDIDLFCADKQTAESVVGSICTRHKTTTMGASKNAYTVTVSDKPIQIIHRWTFADPKGVIESFDFTIAQAAIWWDGSLWQSLCSAEFKYHAQDKLLIYTNPDREEDAGGAIKRAIKFSKMGYNIDNDNLSKVVARLVEGMCEFKDVPNEELFLRIKTCLDDTYSGFEAHSVKEVNGEPCNGTITRTGWMENKQ